MKTPNTNALQAIAAMIKRARAATTPETAVEARMREQERITTQKIRAELLLGASRTV